MPYYYYYPYLDSGTSSTIGALTMANTDTATWSTWNSTSTSSSTIWYYWNEPRLRIVTPPEIIAAPAVVNRRTREEEEARAREIQRREEERLAAITRAKELCLAHLSEEQRQSIAEKGWFVVEGGKSKDHYRINVDRGSIHGNVQRLDRNGKAVSSLCFQLQDYNIPAWDTWLAQGLALRWDEEATLRVANESRLAA